METKLRQLKKANVLKNLIKGFFIILEGELIFF